MTKATGDVNFLVFMVVFVALMNILLVMFDESICPDVSAQNFNYTPDYNESYEYIRSQKCEGMSNWYYLVINTPFLFAIGLITWNKAKPF